MLLSIYNLDDSSGRPLCSFGQGEHVIGRGSPLKCDDKRISRKHAQIDVLQNTATITAKHQILPCFYRAAEGNHISILKFDRPVELSSGDRFGFFPDKDWFKIKITTSTENQNNSIEQNENLNETSSDLQLRTEETLQNNSTINNSNINESSPNRNTETDLISNDSNAEEKPEIQVEEIIEENDNDGNRSFASRSTLNNEDIFTTTSEVNNPTNQIHNSSPVVNNDDHLENISLNIHNTDNLEELVDNSDSSKNINNDNPSIHNNADPSREINNIENVGNVLEENSTPACINTSNNEDGLEVHAPNIHSAETTRDENEIVPEVPEENSAPDLPLNSSNNEDGLEVNDPNIHSAETTRDENEIVPDLPVEIKQEVDDEQSIGECSNVKVKDEPVDPDYDANTSSGAASNTNKVGVNTQKGNRDRCWYGLSCYRKNDEHRLKFSHPNDRDYDTDPDDPRPSCSFGGTCYRRNKDHRKNFKHSRFAPTTQQPPSIPMPMQQSPTKNRKRKNKKPTKRDNEGDDGDGLSQSNVIRTKRRRKNKNLAESPLDELDDPFIDDSEDEFYMDTDESESEDDSQSQTV